MTHAYNFLEKIEPSFIKRRHARRKHLRVIVFLCAGFFLLLFFAFVAAGGSVWAQAQEATLHVRAAKEAVEQWDFATAQTSLIQARDLVERLHQRADFLSFLAPLPWIGDQVSALIHTLEAGGNFLDTLVDVCEVGEDVVLLSGLAEDLKAESSNRTFADLPKETKRAVLARFSEASSDFAQASVQLDVVEEELRRWGAQVWFVSEASPFFSLLDQLRSASNALDTLHTFAAVLPEFGGLNEQKTFLLLFLNNAELRPGGGFIGTYGLARVEDGDLESVETKDVYALDRLTSSAPAAPTPLQTYNATSGWFLRDANWSPDFALSSLQVIERFIAEGQSLSEEQKQSVPTAQSVHGVIGFTPHLVSDILALTGPLTVSGQTFTSENFADAMEYQVEVGYVTQGIPTDQRKEILADVVSALVARLEALPSEKWPDFLEILSSNITQKHLALYSARQETQEALTVAGWAGRVLPSSVDTLMVVDANLASLKTDPVVKRTIAYEVFQNSQGDWIGRTRITYAHTGFFDWKTTRYRTYTRLYVPLGTTLIDTKGSLVNDRLINPSGSEGVTEVGTDLGLVYFGAFTSVEPGQTQELIFEYLLSDQVVEAIENGTYTLDVFKQMGADYHDVKLSLEVNSLISYAVPAEEESAWGDETYSLNTILDQDKTFEVLFEPASAR